MDDSINEILADHNKQDRRITWVLILSAVVAVLVGLGTPAVISNSNTTRQVQQSANLASCRSQAASAVTEARTEFDVARSERDTVATHLTVLTNEGLVAAVTGDDARFDSILQKLPQVRQELLDAETRVIDVTSALRMASARYAEQLVVSRTEPTEFLAACRARR